MKDHFQTRPQGSLRGSPQGSAFRRTKGFVFYQLQESKQHGNFKTEKAAGPERPASAAGIGPFGLRFASRALRAGQRPTIKGE
jgi:hypothetical protein